MARKILRVLTKNLPFKILAIGLSFILWLVVYNIDDPKITQTYTTKVTIENASTITQQNRYYQVVDNTNVVTFAVTAKRSILKDLGNSDFRAVADMNQMTLTDGGTGGSVPIEISSSRWNSSLTFLNKKYLKLSLENLVNKRFMITAAASGTVAEGYALGDVTVTNPTMLRVTGPESVVNRIASVVASIDVEGVAVSLTDSVIPLLYDSDGNEISTTALTLSNETVAVTAKIQVIKELSLSVSVSGEPETGYRVVEVFSNPESVRAKGVPSVINPITEVVIPAEIIHVGGFKSDLTTTIDITEFLPDGVSLVNASDARVSVTVRIEPYRTLRYLIRSGQINVLGLESGYEAVFPNSMLYVTVSGLQKDMSELTANSITGSVDATGLGEGTYSLHVTLDLDEEYYTYADLELNLTIRKIEPEIDEESESEDDSQREAAPTEPTEI